MRMLFFRIGATSVGGRLGLPIARSIWFEFSADTSASSLPKNCTPKPSMCGLVPQYFGFVLNTAAWPLRYLKKMNGPPLTSGSDDVGVLATLRSPFPSPVAYCAQHCF